MMLRRFVPPTGVLSVVLLLLLPAGVSDAQVPDDGPSSIGFANPDSTQPVRAYRLPTWHWSTWTLRANGSAFRSSEHIEDRDLLGVSSDRDSDRFSVDLGLNPVYRSLWESEDRRAFLRLSPSLGLSRSGVTRKTETEKGELDNAMITTGVDLLGTLREYVASRTFLFADSDANLAYRGQRAENEGDEETTTELSVRADVRLGVGVGRVRVVTPVIRALRVRERLRKVAPGTSVSDGQVQAAARQLARRPGYQAVYDRSDKYFWRDFFDQVDLAQRSAFETFYVADVLREPVGIRREGAAFVAGPFGTYDRDLRREERDGQLVDRTSFEAGTVGGFARGRWYRNITLRHQLGVDVGATYRHFVDSQGPLDHEFGLNAEGQWLWVLADRLRLDTRLRADVRFQSDPRGGETFRPSHQYLLSSDLVLFIENSLFLSAGANVQYRYDATSSSGFRTSEFDTGLQFRLNYVLSRALR